MKPLDVWLLEYGVSHTNKINRYIHKVCVPLILWASIALFYCIPVPHFLNGITFNWSYLLVILGLCFYLFLSLTVYILMFIQTFICLSILKYLSSLNVPIFSIALFIFIISWIGQFIGHKIEGKKPSFFKDVQFLLIGPVWVFFYKR